jgi:hypothetical protein
MSPKGSQLLSDFRVVGYEIFQERRLPPSSAGFGDETVRRPGGIFFRICVCVASSIYLRLVSLRQPAASLTNDNPIPEGLERHSRQVKYWDLYHFVVDMFYPSITNSAHLS